jgi:hypothetical protein
MESVTSRDGTTIAHETYGQGPPLITVCGATCDRALMRPTAQALSQHFMTVNYDRRGRLCQGSLSGHSGTLPWWLLEGVEADDRAGQHGQRVEPFGISLVADWQPSEAAKPGPAVFDRPAVAAQPLRRLDHAPGDSRADATPAQVGPAAAMS